MRENAPDLGYPKMLLQIAMWEWISIREAKERFMSKHGYDEEAVRAFELAVIRISELELAISKIEQPHS